MFDIRYEGKSILSVDEQVTAVRLQSSRGETAVTGIAPHEGVIDIILDRVAPGGPPRLDQIEAQSRQAIRDNSEEGAPVGFARDNQVVSQGARMDQGAHDETLREGGVDTAKVRATRSGGQVPSRDLAAGLDKTDTEALTKRLEAFDRHGDADKAIEENGPSKDSTTTGSDVASQPVQDSGEGSEEGGSSTSPSSLKLDQENNQDQGF